MPRLPTLRIQALSGLERQLRYETPEAARLKLQRAEVLLLELLSAPAGTATPEAFPESWVLYRLTGLRLSEDVATGQPQMLVREALVGDLCALIDRLSSAAKLAPDPAMPTLSVDDLLSRWNISRATLARLRRKGLFGRRITLGPGRQQQGFDPAHVPLFERLFEQELARAAAFSRIDSALAAQLRLSARKQLRERPMSLTACARALAKAHARSPQAIARVLTESIAGDDPPPFTRPKSFDAHDVERVRRARARGVPLARAAKAAGRSRSAAYRRLAQARLDAMLHIDLIAPMSPLLERADAADVLLSPPIVRTQLAGRWGRPLSDILLLPIDALGQDAHDELALTTAWALLRRRARAGLASANRASPRAAEIDDVHTDLLWAARLKATLCLAHLPLIARAAHSAWSRPLNELPPATHTLLASAGLAALLDALDRFDPFKGGRLAAAAGVPIARAIGRTLHALPSMPPTPPTSPAAPTIRTAARRVSVPAAHPVNADDFTHRVYPWQAELDLSPAALRHIPALKPPTPDILRLRFGLDGAAPISPSAIAQSLSLRPARVAQLLRQGLVSLEVAQHTSPVPMDP